MACILQNGSFPSSDGVSTSSYKVYIPEGEVRAVVLLSHGMCEYTERYAGFADWLCERGIAFLGADHIGHGDTAGSGDKLGYIPKNGGRGFLREDLYSACKKAKELFPEAPVFLFCHSMGSFIGRYFEEKYSHLLAGIIISGTSGANPLCGAGKLAANGVISVKGGKHRSMMLKKLAFGGYTARITDSDDPNAWLTRDSAVVEKYSRDPYCNYLFTAEGFYTLFDLLQTVSREEWFKSYNKELPTLIISGEEDPVGAYGAGPSQVYRKLDEEKVKDITLRICPGARHEVINETDKEEHYEYIANWMLERI